MCIRDSSCAVKVTKANWGEHCHGKKHQKHCPGGPRPSMRPSPQPIKTPNKPVAKVPAGLSPLADGTPCTSHTVLVVDNSGSMRERDITDCPGLNRSNAVYRCLADNFIPDQLRKGCGESDVCTLIEFDNEARVVFSRLPFGKELQDYVRLLGESARPRDHGNYVPAFELAERVILRDAKQPHSALALIILTDGKPSDAPGKGPGTITDKHCARLHGLAQNLEARLNSIPDRFHLSCLGFGQSASEFVVLRTMAAGLSAGVGKFQHIQLNMSSISSALSSVTESLTETRASVLPPIKQRALKNVTSETNTSRLRWIPGEYDVYEIVRAAKQNGHVEAIEWGELDASLAVRKAYCAEGSERFVYRALLLGDGRSNEKEKIVKENKYVEKSEAESLEFHSNFRKVHSAAAQLAKAFNTDAKRMTRCSDVRFVVGTMLACSKTHHGPRKFFFLEELLEGEYLKWNNNNGFVSNWSSQGSKTIRASPQPQGQT
eukprot:TRINITY_DN14106_c0_g1_i1.p1 TRINITY_DN14106_c0_g1~~TRINITY_DN14106_c0_g1_i1.p1  ORF type:complete len:489 (-),score=60.97 TRINITY_DN14106_c0_g1_i1:1309-2775(-)